MIDHGAIRLACRAHARALAVCTTGVTTLAATASGYTRASGSFLTDGFRAGMEVTPSGFTTTTRATITAVTALTMTVHLVRAVDSAAGSRSLAAGLPASVAYENVQHTATAPVPWVSEQYLPGALRRLTAGAFGLLEATGLYALTLHVRPGDDTAALDAYTRALLTHFAPDTPLTLSTGDITRVRGEPAPFVSPLAILDGGWAVQTVSIPLLTRTQNSR